MNTFLKRIYEKYDNNSIFKNPEYLELENRYDDLGAQIITLERKINVCKDTIYKAKNKGPIYNFFKDKDIKKAKEACDKYNSEMQSLNNKQSDLCNEKTLFLQKFTIESYIKDLKQTSPNYDMLWEMCEFIQYASAIWFYANNKSSEIYTLPFTNKNHKTPYQGFVVQDLNGLYTITVKLLNNNKVDLATENKRDCISYTYHFKDNDWDMDYDIADEMAVEYAQSIIMKAFAKVFMFCYNLK